VPPSAIAGESFATAASTRETPSPTSSTRVAGRDGGREGDGVGVECGFGGQCEDDERRVARGRTQRRDDGPEADRAADVQRHDDDRAAAAGSQPEEAAEQHLQSFVVLYRADDGPVGRVLEQTEGQYRYRDERAHLNVAVPERCEEDLEQFVHGVSLPVWALGTQRLDISKNRFSIVG